MTRVNKVVGDDEWCVAYFGIHAASAVMWDVAKKFADDLALSLGFRPGGRVDIDCFVGRYSSTYTGVHVDYAHNFAFTLRNGKTMFTWPPNRADVLGMKSPAYECFKSEGVPLENCKDRVAYFPQDFFHVAESKNDISVNVNIAFWEKGDDAQTNIEYVTTFLRAPAEKFHPLRLSGITNLNPADEYRLTALKTMVDDGALKRRMAIGQLISDTSARLNVGRPSAKVFQVDDIVAINKVSTLQWMPMQGLSEILVAANGHCTSLSFSQSLAVFLDRLCAGEEVDISTVQSDEPGGVGREILKVISALAKWGAL